MKILHVYKTYYPYTQGGVERVIEMLSEQTTAMGCQNRLLTCTPKKEASVVRNASLDVYYYPKTIEVASSPFSYALWKAFPEQVEWADVIHYHFPWPMADLLHCGHRIKKPSIITYHSDVVRQKHLLRLYWPLMQRFLKKMDCIVSTSVNYAHSSLILKSFTHKIRVIPIGLNSKQYKVNSKKQKEWQNKLPNSFILFVGVLRYYKGLEYLLTALNNTGITLVIAGEGPLLDELKAQAATLQNATIIFTEELISSRLEDDDLCAIYSLSQALVIPASHRSEAYCIALVEGLLFGLPLISTELGTGTSFVNQHNVTGLVVPACDANALKSAITTLLDDEKLLKKMSITGRERFEKLFTADLMGQLYLKEYVRLSHKK
jgi:glycosyltransferase involved in cell wall biosynthesis